MWGELTWFTWSDFVLKWSDVKWVTVKFLGTKVPCKLGWPFTEGTWLYCQSQWPRGLRRRSVAARPLRLWVRIPPGAWMFVCCECCVLSGRGLCDELITRPEESYRLWCVVVSDLETSWMRRPCPTGGAVAPNKINLDCTVTISFGVSLVLWLF